MPFRAAGGFGFESGGFGFGAGAGSPATWASSRVCSAATVSVISVTFSPSATTSVGGGCGAQLVARGSGDARDDAVSGGRDRHARSPATTMRPTSVTLLVELVLPPG